MQRRSYARNAGENPDTPDITRQAIYAKYIERGRVNYGTCAGRIFLAPECKQPPGATQLYINYGYAQHGCQKVPEWVDALSPVCSKQQYDETMAKLVAQQKASGLGLGGQLKACCCGDGSDVESGLIKILNESGWGGTTPPFIVSVDGQSGERFTQDLEYRRGSRSKVPRFRTAPAWEPSGLNVVVTMPGTEAQASWPKTAQVQTPGTITMNRHDVGQAAYSTQPIQMTVPRGVNAGGKFNFSFPTAARSRSTCPLRSRPRASS
tara:strand:+ start:431 stop:1222 length:792 start_codon:yes stop_codon:yes gene_type:complete